MIMFLILCLVLGKVEMNNKETHLINDIYMNL
jgi:hypothetical protein